MLDRSKLLQEFAQRGNELFIDFSSELEVARTYWQMIVADPTLQKKIPFIQSVGSIPTWSEPLDTVYSVEPLSEYQVLAVDGSQIYPDRHQGVSCYLINTGAAYCQYSAQSSAQFSSQPFIASGMNEWGEIAPDIIDCMRTEHELRAGLLKSREYKNMHTGPFVFMFDGSIIFWHLDSKDEATKQRFLTSYITLFQQLCDERIIHAGVISLPKSKELVHIIAAAAKILQKDDTFIHCVDSDIAQFFVQPGTRSAVFKNNSTITTYYPDDLKPYFFYLHTEYEMLRVEIPAWIAQDATLVDTIARIVLDQTQKGYGYPVCLAESHEQAVVKGADREFFYLVLQKMTADRNQRYTYSQKSMKKRTMSV